ncbi:hypothetical protein Dimus_015811 [Dionaea muscipula]
MVNDAYKNVGIALDSLMSSRATVQAVSGVGEAVSGALIAGTGVSPSNYSIVRDLCTPNVPSFHISILDPHVSRTKGRKRGNEIVSGTRRMKSGLEIATKKNKRMSGLAINSHDMILELALLIQSGEQKMLWKVHQCILELNVCHLLFWSWLCSKKYGAKRVFYQIPKLSSLVYFEAEHVAINGFSETNKLGEGGFGSVYKGTLVNGEVVAVKRLGRGPSQGELEFKNEVLSTI